jgi:hypothetical protein
MHMHAAQVHAIACMRWQLNECNATSSYLCYRMQPTACDSTLFLDACYTSVTCDSNHMHARAAYGCGTLPKRSSGWFAERPGAMIYWERPFLRSGPWPVLSSSRSAAAASPAASAVASRMVALLTRLKKPLGGRRPMLRHVALQRGRGLICMGHALPHREVTDLALSGVDRDRHADRDEAEQVLIAQGEDRTPKLPGAARQTELLMIDAGFQRLVVGAVGFRNSGDIGLAHAHPCRRCLMRHDLRSEAVRDQSHGDIRPLRDFHPQRDGARSVEVGQQRTRQAACGRRGGQGGAPSSPSPGRAIFGVGRRLRAQACQSHRA